MLHLKITSLEGLVRNEEIKQLTIDTMVGQITILPGHDNMITVLKPGLARLVPIYNDKQRSFPFLSDKEYLVFGVMGGVLKVEGNQIQVLTNMVITDNQNPIDVLQTNKTMLLEQLQKAKELEFGSDVLEIDIQKIDLEMKLAFWKKK